MFLALVTVAEGPVPCYNKTHSPEPNCQHSRPSRAELGLLMTATGPSSAARPYGFVSILDLSYTSGGQEVSRFQITVQETEKSVKD